MSPVSRLLFAGLVMLAGIPASAADNGLDGNYKLVQAGAVEAPLALIKLETKDGKIEGSVVAAGPIGLRKISNITVEGKAIHFDLQGRSSGNFEGLIAGDTAPGSFQIGTNVLAVKLVKTTDDKIGNARVASRIPEMNEAQTLTFAPRRLQFASNKKRTRKRKRTYSSNWRKPRRRLRPKFPSFTAR